MTNPMQLSCIRLVEAQVRPQDSGRYIDISTI